MGWTKLKKVWVVFGVLLLTGWLALVIFHHRNQYKGPSHFAKASWASVGTADPVAALETGCWATANGNGKVMFDSLTPELQGYVRKIFEKKAAAKGMSLEDYFAMRAAGVFEDVIGFRVLDEQMDAHQATIQVYIQGWWHRWTFYMRKVGNDWKVAGFKWK